MQQSPPVAIRVVRPYDSEAEYLAAEGDTVTRSSVTLIGAAPRPQGVILRFEVTLSAGQTMLRGEGRVTGYKERALRDLPGLVLRFTRLDPKSKAFIDRATGTVPPSPPESAPLIVVSEPPDALVPPTLAAVASVPTLEPPPGLAPPPAAGARRDEDDPMSSVETRRASSPPPTRPATDIAEGNRDDALARLRDRRAKLTQEQVSHILTRRV